MIRLQSIVSLIYPAVLLVLFIYSVIQAKKNKGIKYLAFGFGAMFFNSFIWNLLVLFNNYFNIFNSMIFYDSIVFGKLLLFITEGLFFCIGISILAKNSSFTNYISGNFKESIVSKYAASSDFGNIGLYIFLLIMGTFLLVLGIYSGYQSRYSYSSDNIAILMCLAGIILVIAAYAYFIVVLYRVWEFSINESFRLNLSPSIETPGKAVGFLFIPFFNFYWMFIAYGKLSKDLHAIADAKGVVVTMSAELGLILSIFCILSIIPYVGYFTSIFALVLLPVFLNQAIVQCTIIAEVNHKS